MEFGLDKRAQTLQGLAFPLQEEAKQALRQLKQRRINYIQLVSLDRKPLSANKYVIIKANMSYLKKKKKTTQKMSGSIFKNL